MSEQLIAHLDGSINIDTPRKQIILMPTRLTPARKDDETECCNCGAGAKQVTGTFATLAPGASAGEHSRSGAQGAKCLSPYTGALREAALFDDLLKKRQT